LIPVHGMNRDQCSVESHMPRWGALVPVYASNRDRFSEINWNRPPNGTNWDQCLSLVPTDKPNRDRCHFGARPKTHFLLVIVFRCLGDSRKKLSAYKLDETARRKTQILATSSILCVPKDFMTQILFDRLNYAITVYQVLLSPSHWSSSTNKLWAQISTGSTHACMHVHWRLVDHPASYAEGDIIKKEII
jgi:hypothetical protein